MAKSSFKASTKNFCDCGSTNDFKALTRRQLYKMIINSDIREGTYILVKEFALAWAKRINGEGEVLSDAS